MPAFASHPRPSRALQWLLLPLLAGLLCACTGLVSRRIVEPARTPAQLQWTEEALQRAGARFEQLQRADAPDIAYAVLEPGDYGLRYRTYSFRNDTWSPLGGWRALQARAPARHGTVVLVHGWSMDAGMMLPWALAFAESGFRAVLVELRGHGRSGDGPIGYGQREADDVLAVIEHLRAQRRSAEPLYLMGISYGAVTALHTAARMAAAAGGTPAGVAQRQPAQPAGDRDAGAKPAAPAPADSTGAPGDRYAVAAPMVAAPPLAVVAVEPFANAADAIRSMHQFATTSLRGSWRRWVLRNSARVLVRANTLEAAIARASLQLELDLVDLDTSVALAATTTCPLLVHGRIDTVIPYRSSRTLAAVHPAAQLLELPQDGHFSTAGRIDLLADPIANWFVELAAAMPGTCPAVQAPATTLMGYDGFEEHPVPRQRRGDLRPAGGAELVDPRAQPEPRGDAG